MQRFWWATLIIISGLLSLHQATAQETTAPEYPGQIAYIGLDANVYTLSAESAEPTQLTNDSTSSRVYQWPTWSTDGRLAYFVSVADDAGINTEIFISPDALSAGENLYSGSDEVFTYAYWSPQNCADGENCRDLAVLLNDITGVFSVKLIRNTADGNEAIVTGTGAPFYISWSPDGKEMFWQRNNRSLDIYDAGTETILSTLADSPGLFQAPSWSPVDDRLLYGGLNENRLSTNLVLFEGNESKSIASGLAGPVAFAWSPDGSKIAYTDAQGPLIVVDSQTGETITRSSVRGIFSFFWSPDGQHIAYLTLASTSGSSSASATDTIKVAVLQQETGIAWSVLDIDSGETRRYSGFFPTREMVYMLLYFDQFAQSHRVWSPDSHYLVYSELTADNLASVNLLDATSANAIPYELAEGLIGIWSFN